MVPRMTLQLIFFTTIATHIRQDYANTWESAVNLYSFIIHRLCTAPDVYLTIVLLCMSIFRHLKLELLTQFPASNDEKNIDIDEK